MVTPHKYGIVAIPYWIENKIDQITDSSYLYLPVLWNKTFGNTNTNLLTVFIVGIHSYKTCFVGGLAYCL